MAQFCYDSSNRILFKPLSFGKYSFLPAEHVRNIGSVFKTMFKMIKNKAVKKRFIKGIHAHCLAILDEQEHVFKGIVSYEIRDSVPSIVSEYYNVPKNCKNIRLYFVAILDESGVEEIIEKMIAALSNYEPVIIWLKTIKEAPLIDLMIGKGFIKRDRFIAYVSGN